MSDTQQSATNVQHGGVESKNQTPASQAPSDASLHARKTTLSGPSGFVERLRGLFSTRRSPRNKEDEKPKHSAGFHKRQNHKLTRQSLQLYLNKAGYAVNAEKLKRTMFRSVLATFLVLTVALLVIAVDYSADVGHTILIILALWTAFFVGILLIVWAAVYFFLDYQIYRRTRAIEDVLPDFLQLASSNIAAGMSIDKALWYAIRPNFGVLANEMEDVAKATMAGEDLEVSLIHFTERYESVMLRRSINILIEGLRAGGEMADLLNKIALNIEELKIMKKEMAASVTTYAIFITFASIIIAPFLFALATELLTIITKITGSLQVSSASVLSLGKPDPAAIGNFKLFSVLMLIISTIFSASIVSVIKRGNVLEGIKSIPVFAIVAIFIYFISTSLLHGIFSSII